MSHLSFILIILILLESVGCAGTAGTSVELTSPIVNHVFHVYRTKGIDHVVQHVRAMSRPTRYELYHTLAVLGLTHFDRDTVYTVILLLSRMDNHGQWITLRDIAVKRDNSSYRNAAIYNLGVLRDYAAVPFLFEHTDDEWGDVRYLAESALSMIRDRYQHIPPILVGPVLIDSDYISQGPFGPTRRTTSVRSRIEDHRKWWNSEGEALLKNRCLEDDYWANDSSSP